VSQSVPASFTLRHNLRDSIILCHNLCHSDCSSSCVAIFVTQKSPFFCHLVTHDSWCHNLCCSLKGCQGSYLHFVLISLCHCVTYSVSLCYSYCGTHFVSVCNSYCANHFVLYSNPHCVNHCVSLCNPYCATHFASFSLYHWATHSVSLSNSYCVTHCVCVTILRHLLSVIVPLTLCHCVAHLCAAHCDCVTHFVSKSVPLTSL